MIEAVQTVTSDRASSIYEFPHFRRVSATDCALLAGWAYHQGLTPRFQDQALSALVRRMHPSGSVRNGYS